MINQFVGVGRLTKDLELKATQGGTSLVNFNLAIDKGKDNQGNDLGANFIPCVAWGKRAETMATYLHKGSKIGVVGEIQTRSYQDITGRNVYVVEVNVNGVEFLDSKPQTPSNQSSQFSTVDDYVEEKQQEPSNDSLPF